MDKVIAWMLAIWGVVLTVLLCAELTINKQQQATISALGHSYETCRHYNAIVDCKLAGFEDCEEKVKKLEEQAKHFVRGLNAK